MTIMLWVACLPCYLSASQTYDHVQDKPKHRSNAEQLIKETPPIEVEGKLAICDGG